MNDPDEAPRLLEYRGPPKSDEPEHKVAAILFVLGILTLVVFGMVLVVRFVIQAF